MLQRLHRVFRSIHRRRGDHLCEAIATGLTFESLETRQLMSATLVGDVLTIDGTAGEDVIHISAGAGNGDIVVNNAPGVDNGTAFAGVNTVIINALAGNDKVVVGDNLADALGVELGVTVNGGDGDDTIIVKGGNNTIDAGEGNNHVRTGDGDDTITAGSGADRIRTKGGNNTIDAGDGDNRIQTGKGNDSITTGIGNDRIKTKAGDNVIVSTGGDNQVKTGKGNDDITTGAGADNVKTKGGNNTVNVGAGVDKVKTGRGDDTILAEDDDDNVKSKGGTNDIDTDYVAVIDLGTLALASTTNVPVSLDDATDLAIYTFTIANAEIVDLSLAVPLGVTPQVLFKDSQGTILQTMVSTEDFNATFYPAGTYTVELSADQAADLTLTINVIFI